MTKLLLNLFLHGKSNTSDLSFRTGVGLLSGVTGIVCNALLFVLKLLIGTVSGSVSITADALNNLSDATSSVVTLLGFKLAEKPADAGHPYGHARYEYLAGLAVSALIIVIGFELAKTSVEKIFAPSPVIFSLPLVVVLGVSMVIKLWLAVFNRKLGYMIGSSALKATASDSRNDVIATSAVLAAAVIEHISGWAVDGFIGLAVALFILYSGINQARETISPLLGERASDELRELIAAVITAHPKVLGYHDLMVHDYGPGQRFASLHVEMDQAEDPMLCHEIIDNLERECLKLHKVHLVIHYDPIITGDAELEAMRNKVTAFLEEYDPRLSMHDFRMVRSGGHTNLIFDVVLPFEMMKKTESIRTWLADHLDQIGDTTYYTVINFDADPFSEE